MRMKSSLLFLLSSLILAFTSCATAEKGSAQAELGDVPRMDFQEFKSLYAEDSVIVVDSRSKASYEGGHIPGAILMPLNAVKTRLSELSRVTKPIVVYCS